MKRRVVASFWTAWTQAGAQGYRHAPRRNQAPWQVRAAAFGAVADALGACMATRHRLYEDQLWRTATAVWPSVIAAGLPAVRLA